MKHRGPAASLHPAKMAARHAARAQLPRHRPGRAATGSSASTWRLDTDPDGQLVAVNDTTGQRHQLVIAPAGDRGTPAGGAQPAGGDH